MSSIDFITFVHHRDWERLAVPGELQRRVESHRYNFDKVIVVKQRLGDIVDTENIFSRFRFNVIEVRSENHLGILERFGLPDVDEQADEMTHGPTAPHYWKWHVINHLIGLVVSQADYVVFSDSDCYIKDTPSYSWVDFGIQILQAHPEVLIISPSDGGDMAERRIRTAKGTVRLTQNVSQQVFLCNRERLKGIDFNVPWNWEFTAPGGPMQEYYYMLEGRMWRYMYHHDLYRAILPEAWRYWHDQWH